MAAMAAMAQEVLERVSVVLVECTRISSLAPEAESLSEMDLLSFS